MVDVEIEANRKKKEKKKKRNTRRDLNAIHGVSILPIFHSIARIIILKIMFFFFFYKAPFVLLKPSGMAKLRSIIIQVGRFICF